MTISIDSMNIEFFFDPISPYAWLASTQLSRLEGITGRTVVAKPVTEVISQETSDHYYYTVQAGDNLGLISKEVYGTLTKWRLIANANTDQLENNPNRLRPGMTLVIPPLTETGGILLRPDSSAFLQKIE